MLDALREGGPRNKEGGGARFGCCGEDGSRFDMVDELGTHHRGETAIDLQTRRTIPIGFTLIGGIKASF